MCQSCGCSSDAATVDGVPVGHHHAHPSDSAHSHTHAGTVVELERKLLAHNDAVAIRNRDRATRGGFAMLNLLSSPGAGKTTLLERTVAALPPNSVCVVEGDQATSRNGDRIRVAGARAAQVNTHTGCHLDAAMVEGALRALEPPRGSMVILENVGNLVCPALFDLGEGAKVVLVSVTEGDDKPLKYPHAFAASEVMVITKLDLLPHVPFDPELCVNNALRVNPRLEVLRLCAITGEGMDGWLDYVRGALGQSAPQFPAPLAGGSPTVTKERQP